MAESSEKSLRKYRNIAILCIIIASVAIIVTAILLGRISFEYTIRARVLMSPSSIVIKLPEMLGGEEFHFKDDISPQITLNVRATTTIIFTLTNVDTLIEHFDSLEIILETTAGQVRLTLDDPEDSLNFGLGDYYIYQWQIEYDTKDVARDVSGTIVIEITR